MTRHVPFTQASLRRALKVAREEHIYFVKIGDFIKIGTTTNINKRIRAFKGASGEDIQILETFKGGRETENFFHDLFREERYRNEFFRDAWIIREFLRFAHEDGLDTAIKWTTAWKEFTRRERQITPAEKRRRTLADDARRYPKISIWDALEEQQRKGCP